MLEQPFEKKVTILSNLATRTAKNCPILPIPMPEPDQMDSPEADEISLGETLSRDKMDKEDPKSDAGSLALEFDRERDEDPEGGPADPRRLNQDGNESRRNAPSDSTPSRIRTRDGEDTTKAGWENK